MGAVFVFLIKVNLVIALLYPVYKLAMSRDKQFRFNRGILMSFYLLAPLAVLGAGLTGAGILSSGVRHAGAIPSETGDLVEILLMNALYSTAAPGHSAWDRIVLMVWTGGVIVSAGMLLLSWRRIRRLIAEGVEIDNVEGRLVIVPGGVSPFSIGNTIVMSGEDYSNCGDIILTHERAHIAHRHTCDLTVAQLFAVISWFNPVAWLMISELRDVHEYQADEAVIRAGHAPRQYQMLLIKKAVGTSFAALANSLNHSNLKKRITMMQKSETGRRARWRALALAPAVAVALAATGLPAVSATLTRMAGVSLLPSDTPGVPATGGATPLSVMPDVSAQDAAMPEYGDKVSENSQDAQTPVASENEAAEPVPAQADVPDTAQDGAKEGDTRGIYVVDGKETPASDLASLNPEDIVAMAVDKSGPVPVVRITTKAAGDKVAVAVQDVAEFPGGMKAMMQWLAENIQCPPISAEDKGDNVRVIVKLVVNADGTVSNPTILRSGGELYDAEALRAVRAMPRWIPARNEGEAVASSYVLPITFSYE